MLEKDKYIAIYNSKKHEYYGHTNHGKKTINYLIKKKPKSVIDIGCGHNEFCKILRKNQINAIGIDFACPNADIICDAKNLPFKNKEFELLTAFDMLEHLLTDEVDIVLTEFERISKYFIFSISTHQSINQWQGETLHPTVKPKSWWYAKIIENKGIILNEKNGYILGKWKDTV